VPQSSDFLRDHRAVVGFPDNIGPTKIYYCAIHTRANIVLAACLLLRKPTHYEIWALASNPLYLRTGAAGLLLKKICFKTWRTARKIYLSVAADSYPFITFYDRLLFYGNLGFNCEDESRVSCFSISTGGSIFALNTVTFISYLDDRVTGVAPEASKTHELMEIEGNNSEPFNDAEMRRLTILDYSYPISALSEPMLVDGDSSAATPSLNRTSYVIFPNLGRIELNRMKTQIQLMSSVPDAPYKMGVLPKQMNRNKLILDTLLLNPEIVSKLPPGSPIRHKYNEDCVSYGGVLRARVDEMSALFNRPSIEAPRRTYKNIGIMSHGGCFLNMGRGFREMLSFELPRNVELVTIQTLGYSTYAGITMKHSWDTFQRYLKDIPIEILRQYCPGITPNKTAEGAVYLPIPPNVAAATPLGTDDIAFIDSVKASLKFKFSDLDDNPLIQINAYKPYDLVPDMALSAEVFEPGCRDYMSAVAGLYNSDSDMRNLSEGEISAFLSVLSHTNSDGGSMKTDICYNGIPNTPRLHTLADVGAIQFPKAGRNYWFQQLSNLIKIIAAPPAGSSVNALSRMMGALAVSAETRTRILIVSCANAGNPSDPGNLTNNRMRELTTLMSGKTVAVNQGANLGGDFRKKLMAFGAMLRDDILGKLLGNIIAPIPYSPEAVDAEATAYATTVAAQITGGGAGGAGGAPGGGAGGPGGTNMGGGYRRKSRKTKRKSKIMLRHKYSRRNKKTL